MAKFEVTINAVNLTTSERNALTPTEGDMIYNTSENVYQFYDGFTWKDMNGAGAGLSFGDVWALNTLMNC